MSIHIERSGLFRKYLIRNCALALLPVLLIAVWLYGNMHEQVLVEYEQAQYVALDRMVDSSQRMTRSFVETSVQIAHDTVTSPYQWRSNVSNVINAIERLRLYIAKEQYMGEIILYITGEDKLYTNHGIVDKDVFLDVRYEVDGDWDDEEFWQQMEMSQTRIISGNCYLREGNNKLRVMIHPWSLHGSNFGVIVGLIDEVFFSDMLDMAGNTTFILSDGEVMAASQNASEAEYEVMGVAIEKIGDQDQIRLRQNGVNYSVITKQADNGWTFVSLIRHEGIIGEIVRIQRSAFTLILFLIMFLGWMSLTFARKSYQPIQRLYRALTGVEEAPTNRDELEDIENGVRRLAFEKEEARLQLNESEIYKRDALLTRMCTAGGGEETCRALEKLGVSLSGPGYCVAAVSASYNAGNSDREEILSVIQEQMTGKMYAFEVYGRDPIIVLMGSVDSPELLRKWTEMLINVVKEKNARLGIGSYQETREKIRQSYVDAFVALEASEKRVSYYDDLPMESNAAAWMLPDSLHIRLIQSLKGGEENVALETIEYIRKAINSLGTDQRVRRFALSAFAAQMIPVAQTLPDPTGVSEGLVCYGDEEEFFEHLRVFCEVMMKHFCEKQKEDINSLYDRVKEYVDQHVCDASFSLRNLAQQFNFTDSYMSRFFRDNAGEGFREYVASLRMNRAATLLANSKLSVREVMEEVGYIDVSSFTRKFTKVMGVSPGAYRIAMGNSEDGTDEQPDT